MNYYVAAWGKKNKMYRDSYKVIGWNDQKKTCKYLGEAGGYKWVPIDEQDIPQKVIACFDTLQAKVALKDLKDGEYGTRWISDRWEYANKRGVACRYKEDGNFSLEMTRRNISGKQWTATKLAPSIHKNLIDPFQPGLRVMNHWSGEIDTVSAETALSITTESSGKWDKEECIPIKEGSSFRWISDGVMFDLTDASEFDPKQMISPGSPVIGDVVKSLDTLYIVTGKAGGNIQLGSDKLVMAQAVSYVGKSEKRYRPNGSTVYRFKDKIYNINFSEIDCPNFDKLSVVWPMPRDPEPEPETKVYDSMAEKTTGTMTIKDGHGRILKSVEIPIVSQGMNSVLNIHFYGQEQEERKSDNVSSKASIIEAGKAAAAALDVLTEVPNSESQKWWLVTKYIKALTQYLENCDE